MKKTNVIRICQDTGEMSIVTMSQAIEKLDGYWVNAEESLLNGLELWTPYAKYRLMTKQLSKLKKIQLTIENGASEFQSRWINYAFNELMCNSKPKPSIDKMVEAMQSISDCIEANVGRGGSHVWVTNPNNERIAIIKFN